MINFKRLNHAEAFEYKDLLITVVDLMSSHNVNCYDFKEHLAFVADIISLIVNVCPHCYKDNKGCQCWNDE